MTEPLPLTHPDARVALVFPGQGSQRAGMGEPFAGTTGWELVDDASQAVGRPLDALLRTATAEELRPTREAQLATLLTSLLALSSWRDAGLPAPVVVAGHSLGEYSALVAAGVLDVPGAVRLVSERGEAMRAAADAAPGAMSAVLGLAPEDVVAALPPRVWAANDNAPLHVVVSGEVDAVAAAGAGDGPLRQAGARRVLPLPVGGAFHTPLMAPARDRLAAALAAASYDVGVVPVLSDVTAAPHRVGTPGAVAAALEAQLTAPVRWREIALSLVADHGATHVVELGPGGVLTGLARRTTPGVVALSLADPADVYPWVGRTPQ